MARTVEIKQISTQSVNQLQLVSYYGIIRLYSNGYLDAFFYFSHRRCMRNALRFVNTHVTAVHIVHWRDVTRVRIVYPELK